MSTIKATHIQHPSAASPNFTLASDGTVSGGAGLGGLVHIHTETFASVSIDDVFSAEYDNYLMTLVPVGTGRVALRLRFRSGGTDNTASSYQGQYMSYESTTLYAARETNNSNSRIGAVDPNATPVAVEIMSPFLSSQTVGVSRLGIAAAAASSNGVAVESFGFSGTTSFDGFTLFLASGTFTGTLRIYGYANS
jgi:hypothetical protein